MLESSRLSGIVRPIRDRGTWLSGLDHAFDEALAEVGSYFRHEAISYVMEQYFCRHPCVEASGQVYQLIGISAVVV